MTQQTVIFAGGGTGGHLFPGIAIARALSDVEPTTGCLFVGTNRDVEKEILLQTEFEHVTLPVEPVSHIVQHPVRFLWRHWNAYQTAKQLLQKTSVKCVVGLGGVASLPVLYAARKLSIPVLLIEQNIVLGRANRWFSNHAQGVALSFAETEGVKPAVQKRSRLTGNPVRQEIAMLHESFSNSDRLSAPTLLILGGSQGATTVNRAVMDAVIQVKRLQENNWQIVHQTGEQQVQEVTKFYQQHHINCHVAAFFPEMASLYQSASLVISRAGATTLAELACAGSPAVLIPYPNSLGDHQQKNAIYFERAGAVRIVEQQSEPTQTAQQLSHVLNELLDDSTQIKQMQTAMHNLAIPNAATSVVKMITEITTVS